MGTTSRRWFVWLCMVALSACGPSYRMAYSYDPPRDHRGPMCIGQCETTQRDCSRADQLETENCRLRSAATYGECTRGRDVEHNACLSRQRAVPTTVCIERLCLEAQCTAASTRCIDDYNRCYENCGGHVVPRQECVANCPDQ